MYHRRSEIPRRGAVSNASSQHSGAESCCLPRGCMLTQWRIMHCRETRLRICACQSGCKQAWEALHRWASGAAPAEGDDSADGLGQLQPHDLLPQDAESLRRPRLYMDLRPFVDSGPLTVRQAA